MLLSPEFVLVKEITSNVPRSEFLESELEQAAQLILKAEGTIQPLVLRTVGWESYEVVDGHFEYYAAVRAKEINPRDGERIGAFIIEGDKAEVLEAQVKMLRKKSNISPVFEDYTIKQEATINLSDLAKLLDQRLQPITTKLEQLSTSSTSSTPEFVNSNSQSQGNKIIEEKLENLASKIEQLEAKTNLIGIENILNKQLEVIRQETSNLSQLEALSLLTKTQTALNRQLEAIKNESNQLQKINLLTVETEIEIKQAFKRVTKTTAGGAVAWEAIKHWRQPSKKLTWENLQESKRKGSKDKIQGFSDGVYQKLKAIGYIPD
ncbi:MAG: hypothetical protein WBA93_07110 [Microcoleaceae cyanobacterium]